MMIQVRKTQGFKHADVWALLLCGGNKATQRADIKAAAALAKALEN